MLNLPEDNKMNSYKALVAKLEAITNRPEGQPVPESVQAVDECGAMPMVSAMHSEQPKQQDSVTMNVSMNGSGAEGIRDLMSILKNIEDASEPQHDTDGPNNMIVGIEEPEMEEEIDGGFQSATTEPEEEMAGVDAVTATGNDMHSKGDEAEKVNGGGNPFRVSEGLLSHLTSLYQEVKERDINVDEGIASSIGGAVGSAVQGVKNFVGDVKQGYNQSTAQGGMGYTGMTDEPPAIAGAPTTQAPKQFAQAAPAQGGMPTTQSPAQAAKPANPEMVKIAQQLAAGTLPQDQAIQQLLKLAGQSTSLPRSKTPSVATRNTNQVNDPDW